MDILLEKRTADRGLFDRRFVQNIIQQHRQGHHDYGYIIWLLINLEHWIRVFVEREDVDLSPLPIDAMPKRKIPAFGLGTSQTSVRGEAASL